MSPRYRDLTLLAVIVDCHDPRRQAEWRAQVLAYQVNLVECRR
jgi:hypothetical protein